MTTISCFTKMFGLERWLKSGSEVELYFLADNFHSKPDTFRFKMDTFMQK